MRSYKVKNLLHLRLCFSELSVSNSTMLYLMLVRLNPSLIELLFQVQISIFPLLLPAGVHYLTRRLLQSHTLLRHTQFLYCQLVLVFVSRLRPIHPAPIIRSLLNLVRLIIMVPIAIVVPCVIVVLLFATLAANLVTYHLIFHLAQKNKGGTGWSSLLSIP